MFNCPFNLWISSDYKTQPLLQDTTIITRHNHYYKTQPLLQDTTIITRHNHYYKTQPLFLYNVHGFVFLTEAQVFLYEA